MPVRLPDFTDLGPASGSYVSGRPIAPGPTDYVGPAIQRAGGAIENLGGSVQNATDALRFQQQREQNFDAAANFQAFQNQQNDLARQAKENMPPGGGDTTAAFRTQYQKAANDFASTLTPEQRARFKPLIVNYEGQLTDSLGQHEYAEKQRYALVQEGDRVNANITLARNDPGNVDLQKKLMLQDQQRIDANPSLSPIQKETAKHNLMAMYAAGINPALAQDGSVVKNLFGVQGYSSADDAWRRMHIAENASGNPAAVSSKGALGVVQVMPDTARATAKELGMANVAAMSDSQLHAYFAANPQANEQIGKAYFGKMLQRYGGDTQAAVIAYNAGPGVADDWLRKGRDNDVLPKETQGYVRKVLGGDVGPSGPGGAEAMVGQDVGIGGDEAGGKTPFVNAQGQRYEAPQIVLKPGADLTNLSPGAKGMVQGILGDGMVPELKITAGYATGGHVEHSQHYQGNAIDFNVAGWSDQQKAALISSAIAHGGRGIGIYPSGNSIHIDTRANPTFWGPSPAGIYKGASLDQAPAWAQPALAKLFKGGGGYVPDHYQVASRYVEQRFSGLDPDSVNKMANSLVDANNAFLTQAKADAAAMEQQRKALVDQYQYAARNGQLGESDIEQGWQNGTLKTYEEYSSVRAARKEYLTERDQGAGAVDQMFGANPKTDWNRFEDKDKKIAANAYTEIVRASPDKAIQAVDAIQRVSGIVPQPAANGMRQAIYGTDQNIAGQALQVAANLMTRNPNAFTGVEGGDAISKSAVAYRHYLDQGTSTADAVRRVTEQNDPAYRSKVVVKDADLKTFTDGITPATISHLYDQSPWLPLMGDPRVGVSPEQQGAITQDFKEVAEQFYRESGDPALAMAQAKAQLDKVYGVTTAFGTATLTKYPVERSYPAISDGRDSTGYEYVYRQASEAVKQATGKDIPATDIALLPMPQGETAQAFDAGKPAPYRLAYVDRTSGQPVLEYIYGPNGKAAFVADPAEAQQAIQSGRAATFKEWQGQDIQEQQQRREMLSKEGSPIGPFAPELPPKYATPPQRSYMYGAQSNLGVHDVQPMSTPAWRPGQPENPPPFERPGSQPDIPDGQDDYRVGLQKRLDDVNQRRQKVGLPPVSLPSETDIPADGRNIQHEDVGDTTTTGGKENQGFFSWLVGNDPEMRHIQAKPISGWPTEDDAKRALENGQFYGQDEAFLGGQRGNLVGESVSSPATMAKGRNTYAEAFAPGVMTGRMSDIFDKLSTGTKSKLMGLDPSQRQSIVKSALVANRIPLAALGFDPRKFFIEAANGSFLTVAGAYDQKTDSVLSSLAYNSNLVHESVHRGLEILRKEYPSEMKEIEKNLPPEESIVRWIMYSQAGNQETGRGDIGDQQISGARFVFEDPLFGKGAQEQLQRVNDLAAQLYVKRHGRGPK
jgi:hypothetical protein